jgi:hypothetical protein
MKRFRRMAKPRPDWAARRDTFRTFSSAHYISLMHPAVVESITDLGNTPNPRTNYEEYDQI